jgi:hypothetical protein
MTTHSLPSILRDPFLVRALSCLGEIIFEYGFGNLGVDCILYFVVNEAYSTCNTLGSNLARLSHLLV